MQFIRPSTQKAIPTYRVTDPYGQVLDEQVGVDIGDEEALSLYRNMVFSTHHNLKIRPDGALIFSQ